MQHNVNRVKLHQRCHRIPPFQNLFVPLHAISISMLKQIVVDKVMARQLWKLGFKEPTLSYYNVDGQLQNAEGDTLELKDYNAPKQTRGRGARCYAAPTLSAVQDWLRRKKHLELLVCRDTFFQNTGDYYCRLIRLSDGLSRDTHPRKSYADSSGFPMG